MDKKRILCFVLIGAILFLAGTGYAQTKKLKSIGRYTFVRIRGNVPTQEIMKTLLEKYAGEIKQGFEAAGSGELYLLFLEQLRTASFEEKTLPVGDKLMWMLFRSGGKVKVVLDVEWAGQKPLDVFSFHIMKDNVRYEFVMPKPCGNISLRGMERVEVEVPVPDAVCQLAVSPAKVNIKGAVTVDMSGSQNAKSMEVDVFGPDGAKIASQTLTPGAPKWQLALDKPGNYAFKGRAVNAKGKVSTNACEAKAYVRFAPVAKLDITGLPRKIYVGMPVTFNADSSTVEDGKLAKADFEIWDEAGKSVNRYTDDQPPYSWTTVFKEPGKYDVTLAVTDDSKAVSEPVRISLEVFQKRTFFLAEAGPLFAKGSHGPYFGGRVGVLYKLVPDVLDVVASGGGSLSLKSDPWKSFAFVNLLLNVHAQKTFFGAGFGLSSKAREDQKASTELIGNVGVDIFNNITTIGSIFFEGRGALGASRSLSKNHKLMLGFRMLF
jgi:hypothetical protein